MALRTILLDQAVREIVRARNKSVSENARARFFWIVGAGISSPSVPLAGAIENECREYSIKAGETADCVKPASSMSRYSHWMEQAFRQPIDRQKYLRGLIERKPITHSNFRLAHLLTDTHLARFVVTPNFDDFLSRALTIFGTTHRICDHPATAERLSAESDEVQILHVHGNYWFYDCCNLATEIEARAQPPLVQAVTVPNLLDSLLSNRSPLVVGYSGWEGDVIMQSLERRLRSRLPYLLYWFCYSREQVAALPVWLKDNQDVCVIVPPERPADTGLSRENLASTFASSGTDERGNLPAHHVFDQMLRALDFPTPDLTQDPLSFFARQLDSAFPADDSLDGDADIYGLQQVRKRVLDAATFEASRTSPSQPSEQTAGGTEAAPLAAAMEDIQNLIRSAKYPEAIQKIDSLDWSNLSSAEQQRLGRSAYKAATSLLDDSEEKLRGYELAAKSPYQSDRSMVAKSLLNQGFTLNALERSDEAIAVYDALLARFADSTEPEIRESLAKALLNKGATLHAWGRSEEAIAIYDALLARFADATEPALREQLAKAIFNKGNTLGALERSDEAIAAYDALLARFADATEPALREALVKAMFNKGVTLGALGRSDQEIVVYGTLLARFADATEPTLREPLARAMFNNGVTLNALGRSDEAIAVYDALLARFADATEPALRELFAMTMFNKGVTLNERGRSDEAIAVFDALLARFAEATEPALRKQFARAMANKGGTLGELGRRDEAIAVFDALLARFADATEPSILKITAKARQAIEALRDPKQ